jgi:K+ transporter
MGILSLIFWSLILVVTIKYVTLIMRADNRGEGGILALMALAQRVCVGARMRSTHGFIGITGACLFFGDGLITPAISVLSAVEGVEVSAPGLQRYVPLHRMLAGAGPIRFNTCNRDFHRVGSSCHPLSHGPPCRRCLGL